MTFYSNLFTQRRSTTHYEQIDNVTFCGKAILKNYEQIGPCISYKKCIYKGTVYHSKNYLERKKTDDSYCNGVKFKRV